MKQLSTYSLRYTGIKFFVVVIYDFFLSGFLRSKNTVKRRLLELAVLIS